MRGRIPIPKHLRILSGTASGNAKRVRRIPSATPSAPDFLDKEAKSEWRRITRELKATGLLTRLDRGLLSLWCAAWSDFTRARQVIAEQGATFTTATGYTQSRPEVSIARYAALTLMRLAPEFGLSPMGRQRLELVIPPLPVPLKPAGGSTSSPTPEEITRIEQKYFS